MQLRSVHSDESAETTGVRRVTAADAAFCKLHQNPPTLRKMYFCTIALEENMQWITAQSLFSCSVFAGKSSIYGPVLSRCTAGGGELCLGNEKEKEEEKEKKENYV